MHGGIVHVHPVLGVQNAVSVGVHVCVGFAVLGPFTNDDHAVLGAHHWDQHCDGVAVVFAFQFLQFAASLEHLFRVEGQESLGAEHFDDVFACWVDGSHCWEVDTGLADVVFGLGDEFVDCDVELHPFGVGHAEFFVLSTGCTTGVLDQCDHLVGRAGLSHPQGDNLDARFLVQAFQVLGLVQQVPDAFGLGLDDSHFNEGGVVGHGGGGVHF